ncbi:phosphodiester glycosidase family protein [Thalassobacter stenotrophicus]|uniref:phosphodiester glycosidase family protein n=1 Tax=Thalassobacter stenotrophicus TaxID=266809 RepID=UPI0022A9C432|nr:phosphodiester glycosidase family protein [Thalassobacter stenotrophicus]UYP67797.1 phosphodiester glycosidase family protein [Thalassobacter stenotrophicus]
MILRAAIALLCLLAAPAVACEQITHRDARFTVCEVAPDARVELFLRDEAGDILGAFSSVKSRVDGTVVMAMNAGMYHDDRRPVGLYIEDGIQQAPIVTRAGPGNFGLLPNGVFCLRADRSDVIESRAFAANPPACTDATQSGPMLVINGALHPRFLPNSTSRNIRNGVGTSADGQRVVFAISDDAVTFHEFGTLFRDTLDLPNALYFDGRISRLYAPAVGRNDFGLPLGPIVAVIAD